MKNLRTIIKIKEEHFWEIVTWDSMYLEMLMFLTINQEHLIFQLMHNRNTGKEIMIHTSVVKIIIFWTTPKTKWLKICIPDFMIKIECIFN
jgi:hypothetical protein